MTISVVVKNDGRFLNFTGTFAMYQALGKTRLYLRNLDGQSVAAVAAAGTATATAACARCAAAVAAVAAVADVADDDFDDDAGAHVVLPPAS